MIWQDGENSKRDMMGSISMLLIADRDTPTHFVWHVCQHCRLDEN
jgi:hypothetical protein